MSALPHHQWSPLRLGPTERVCVLTGAGISAESGLGTFRDAGGLWEQHPVEQVASPAGWAADRQLVWRFYSERRRHAAASPPNAAHRALAALQQQLGDRLFLVTQNVDDLHERAGHHDVVHMHGELFSSRCEREACDRAPFEDHQLYLDRLPRCEACQANLRPDIVWFGEVPLHMGRIARELERCDVFVTVGSSGAVYPAAGFVAQLRLARELGRHNRLVYVGPEAPDNADYFDECRLGTATAVLPNLFELATTPSEPRARSERPTPQPE